MAKAMVSTVSPKASATPANPMPSAGNAAASTAAPQPPKTSQKVPNISATQRLNKDIFVPVFPRFFLRPARAQIQPSNIGERNGREERHGRFCRPKEWKYANATTHRLVPA